MDVDGAYRWLSKALKKLMVVSSLSQIRVEPPKPRSVAPVPEPGQEPAHPAAGAGVDAGGTDADSAPATCPVPSTCIPPGQAAVILPMIARAAVVLGYLHFDGEATRADAGEACRLFKLAAACGSREGERVLGW